MAPWTAGSPGLRLGGFADELQARIVLDGGLHVPALPPNLPLLVAGGREGVGLALGGEVLAQLAVVGIGTDERAGLVVDDEHADALLAVEIVFHRLGQHTGGLRGLAAHTIPLAILCLRSHSTPSS